MEGAACTLPVFNIAKNKTCRSAGTKAKGIEVLNEWVAAPGLTRGKMVCERFDPENNEQRAISDLVWPSRAQEEMT